MLKTRKIIKRGFQSNKRKDHMDIILACIILSTQILLSLFSKPMTVVWGWWHICKAGRGDKQTWSAIRKWSISSPATPYGTSYLCCSFLGVLIKKLWRIGFLLSKPSVINNYTRWNSLAIFPISIEFASRDHWPFSDLTTNSNLLNFPTLFY